MSSSSNNKREHQEAELEQKLRLAARSGNMERVRELIEIDRVNVNCTDENGRTPLIFAVLNGHFQVAEFLVQKLANMDVVDNEGCTAMGYAMLHAMISNNIAIFRLLIESRRANVDQQFQVNGEATFSPLGFAIVSGASRNVDMVRLLLQFDANTVETLCCGKTLPALHQACKHSSTEVVRLLLDHEDGVNANTQIRWRSIMMTPLCLACLTNNIEVAQFLVEEHGAQVIYNGVDSRDTPRPLARAVNGSMELIRFLLGKLPQGDNAAALSQPLETALYYNKLEAAQLLLDHGADVNGQPYLYMCATLWHRPKGVDDRVSFLLEKGADVNMSMYGETPLFAAADRGNFELVKLFVNATADVNIRSNRGETPLEAAYRGGHKGIVSLLLRTSPDVWPRLRNVL